MKITEKWIKKHHPCPDGVRWLREQFEQSERDGKSLVRKLMKEKRYEWANWMIVRIMKYKEYVQYAVYAAEQVIDIYEKQYPNDEKPRKAIKAAKKCIKRNTAANRYAARVAVYADVSSYSPYSAVKAAYSSAYLAAYSADYSDYSAAYSADAVYLAICAVAAENNFAAKEKMQIKILKYGMKLIK